MNDYVPLIQLRKEVCTGSKHIPEAAYAATKGDGKHKSWLHTFWHFVGPVKLASHI